MAAGKRKAEGIALLSLYNDESDDEEDEEEGEDDVPKQESQQEQDIRHHDFEEEEKEEAHAETITTVTEMVSVSVTTVEVLVNAAETLVSTLPVASSQEDDDLIMRSPLADRPENGAHGIFVDYAHDEGALSPDAEEGEIMTTGRAVLALGAQVSNGFFQGVTPPSFVRQETNEQEDQSPQLKLEATQQPAVTTTPPTDSFVQGMMDAKLSDTAASDTDALADFLPPLPAAKCSQELQDKFAKFLAYKNAGRSFNKELRKSKGYRNPDFLQHAVKHQEIDQIGSCFNKEIFNPHGYDPSDFYDALALEFKREQERKEHAKKQSQRVDFVHGGIQTAPASDKAKSVQLLTTEQRDQTSSGTRGLSTEAAPKSDSARSNKKSKWDEVDTDTKAPVLMPTVAKSAIAAASAHTALLTANAGGGYASFVLQKRKEVEERSRGSERKLDRK